MCTTGMAASWSARKPRFAQADTPNETTPAAIVEFPGFVFTGTTLPFSVQRT